MTENKSNATPPPRDPPPREPPPVIAERGDKGIIVMPVDAAPLDITSLAPSGPPAAQQAAPSDSAPPSGPPSSES